jgi:signal transduction histidine kinase
MVLLTIGGLVVIFLTNRIVLAAIFRVKSVHDFADFESFRRFNSSILLISLAVFVIYFIIINRILSRRMTKKITEPLEILNNGVKQIHENNFSYRIEYHNDDEFYSVCETFNLMAAQLDSSANRRLKDEANRRELLAGISHDLRTPLTSISGYLDGLESGVASTPEMKNKYFNTIKNKTDNMKYIIEQLFIFSKLDMEEYPFIPCSFNIKRALSDMTEEIEEEYAARGLKIIIKEFPENIFVNADVINLRRVLINIFENSVMYKTKESGCLEISASIENNFAQIKFADDGPGVNTDVIPDLFNAFYRTDPSRHLSNRETAGSGLGLAISAKIIERFGGTINAENGDSGGLVITIRLPIEKEA